MIEFLPSSIRCLLLDIIMAPDESALLVLLHGGEERIWVPILLGQGTRQRCLSTRIMDSIRDIESKVGSRQSEIRVRYQTRAAGDKRDREVVCEFPAGKGCEIG